jgi:hypothetical protein
VEQTKVERFATGHFAVAQSLEQKAMKEAKGSKKQKKIRESTQDVA